MATLPSTGAEISFGKVHKAFTNIPPDATSPTDAPAGGKNIKLSEVLGNKPVYTVGQAVGTQISFSATFGGKTTPYPYG